MDGKASQEVPVLSGVPQGKMPSKHAYVGPTWANVGIGAATSPSGDDVGPTLFQQQLPTLPDDGKSPSGDDVLGVR